VRDYLGQLLRERAAHFSVTPQKIWHALRQLNIVTGRSLRTSNRTVQLNIAVTPRLRDQFCERAQEANCRNGEEFLRLLMERYVRDG